MNIRKIACLALSAALFAGSIPGIVFADEPEVITGTYYFTSDEGSNIQLSDEFTFREDCFMQSSFIGCNHLAALSAQAAMASSSRYGDAVDPYDVDPSGNAVNIINMLNDMGFSNVETNTWYTVEKEENSCGVAMGRRTIIVDGQPYTLLAVIPRSTNYKREWAGDMTVGTGNIHEGFLEARDECLRFVRQYIQEHGITGDLKIWIAGHSRGGAISNLIGGFLAGGGAEYLGSDVSLTPDNIYCYTFATPRPVRTGVTNAEALSVSGARGGEYASDTPGDPYVYTGEGTVNLTSSAFQGIRNYPCEWDLITYLPLSSWGFTYYGNVYSFDTVSEDQMLTELQSVSTYVYNRYVSGGSPYAFHEKTFDLATMSLVDTGEGGRDAAIAYLSARVSAFTSLVPDTATLVNSGYQETLKSLGGIYGMMGPLFSMEQGMAGKLVQPVALCYLAYASEQLMAEGRAANEEEGIGIAITELLGIFLNKSVDPATYTVDEFIVDLATFVKENQDSPLVQKIIDTISTSVPEQYVSIIQSYLGIFYPGYDSSVPLGDVVVAYLNALVDGAAPGSQAYEDQYTDYSTGAAVRYNSLYKLALLMPFLIGSQAQAIVDAIGYDASHQPDGSGTFTGFAYAIIQVLAGDSYTNIQDTADTKLRTALESVMNDLIALMENNNIYPQPYIDACRTYVNTMLTNIHDVRELIMTLLLYNGGSFSTEYCFGSLCTAAGNVSLIPVSHFDETYIAYAKAAARQEGPHYISPDEQVITYNMTAGADVAWTGSGTISFTAERSIEPSTTYDHFTGVAVDNELVDPSMYSTANGSIIVTLSEAFLMTLADGRHLIRIEFNDGFAEAYFFTGVVSPMAPASAAESEAEGTQDEDTTTPAGDSSIASTGEEMNYAAIVLLTMGVMCLLVSIKKKREYR